MSITSSRIWTYCTLPGKCGLQVVPLVTAMPGQEPVRCEIVDLTTGRDPDWWAGRVACSGGCQRLVYVAIVNARENEIPHALECPECRQRRAVPEIYWGKGYKLRCACGHSVTLFGVTGPQKEIDRTCPRCKGQMTDIERWPFPS